MYGMWVPWDYVRGLLFGIWWPGRAKVEEYSFFFFSDWIGRAVCDVQIHDETATEGTLRQSETAVEEYIM